MSEQERRLWWKQRREASARKEARRLAAQALGMSVYEYCKFIKSNRIISEMKNGNRNTEEMAI